MSRRALAREAQVHGDQVTGALDGTSWVAMYTVVRSSRRGPPRRRREDLADAAREKWAMEAAKADRVTVLIAIDDANQVVGASVGLGRPQRVLSAAG